MLFEVVTIDLHYMTDRQEHFDLKISKLIRVCKAATPFILFTGFLKIVISVISIYRNLILSIAQLLHNTSSYLLSHFK